MSSLLLREIADIPTKQGLGSGSDGDALRARSGGAPLRPSQKQALDYLHGPGWGEAGALLPGLRRGRGVGVGIAEDTGIDPTSVGAQLTVGVPLDAVVTLSGRPAGKPTLQAGLHASSQPSRCFEARSEGRLDAAELAKQRGVIGTNAWHSGSPSSGIRGLSADPPDVEAGVYALGTSGQVASQTFAFVGGDGGHPVGQILLDGIRGVPRFVEGVTETAQAMAWMAEKTLSVGLEANHELGRIVTPPGQLFQLRPATAWRTADPADGGRWQAMAANLLGRRHRFPPGWSHRDRGRFTGQPGAPGRGRSKVTDSLLLGAMRGGYGERETAARRLRAAPGRVRDETLELP